MTGKLEREGDRGYALISKRREVRITANNRVMREGSDGNVQCATKGKIRWMDGWMDGARL
jgi:hypothetical protein